MLSKIRYWSFPVALAAAWMVVSGYTLTQLVHLPFQIKPPAASRSV